MALAQAFIEKLNDRTLKVGVIGLGYVGLPFAVEKAKMGYEVVGIDYNQHRVDQVNRGENYIGDVDDDELRELVASGKLRATTDYDIVPELDAIVIAVPTPLDKNLAPDLRFIVAVTKSLAPRIRPGQLVSLESTTFPGTTEEVMLPILAESGLKVEDDFFLAHSPERVDPGNRRYHTKNTNKVVGGVGPKSLEIATLFYRATIDHVVQVSNAKAAEMVKVFENTFRAVNIALVNELLKLCDRMDLSVWEVLEAANTKPFGIMRFMPGPGVGGHCIPLDPHYLEWKAREYNFTTRFIALAGEINRSMPEFTRAKAVRVLNRYKKAISGAKLLVLGVAYKRDIDDPRESPSIDLIRLLQEAGACVAYHDPHIPQFNEHGVSLTSVDLTPEILAGQDLVIIATDHTTVDYEFVVEHAKAVFDTRNAASKVERNREKIVLL